MSSINEAVKKLLEYAAQYPILQQRVTELLVSNNQFEERARKAERRSKQMYNSLFAAKRKLELYREQHSGEYVGGMEYTALMKEIDIALADGT